VSVRVSPTERIRAEIDALFGGDRELGEVIEDVARLGARLIIQTALEAGVDAFLGRARYQRSAAAVGARPGMRNGYSPATVKTTAGPVTIARPKLRGTTEAFASRLSGTAVTKSNALESVLAKQGHADQGAAISYAIQLERPGVKISEDGWAALLQNAEDKLFDLIEYFHDHVSAGVEDDDSNFHSYNGFAGP
jgi:hypothetical protein